MIYLDIDGVLANFVRGTCRLFDKPEADVKQWSYFSSWGISANEFYLKISRAGPDFWLHLEKYPWADQLVSLVAELDPEFYFCTSATKCPTSFMGKMQWLLKHYPQYADRCVLMGSKHLLARSGRLLIDDNDDDVNRWREHGGVAYLWPAPWNSSVSQTVVGAEDQNFSNLRLLYAKLAHSR